MAVSASIKSPLDLEISLGWGFCTYQASGNILIIGDLQPKTYSQQYTDTSSPPTNLDGRYHNDSMVNYEGGQGRVEVQRHTNGWGSTLLVIEYWKHTF